jgi:hypothetical protein
MPFHRYSVPSYYGGLPGGYDYINDPVTNGDAGVAAFADSKKASGTNAGTYFVAFNEDATSSDVNRPAKALAQNTDALDDLLRRDLALTSRTADVTAGGPVSSIVIAGQVYVGDNGVANTQATRDSLISILDNNDNELLVGSVKVQASLIHDGASNNLVGTQTTGFYGTVTVTLNVAIPAGTTYRVYYGSRSNLATLPKDALTSIKIRGAQEVEASVEALFRDLHSTLAGTNWNDAWLTTINSLARTGLDGRYRLTTVDPGASPAVNTPGNGGTILRDGPSPAIAFPLYDLTNFGTVGSSRYPDPLLASWRLRRVTNTVSTVFDKRYGGDYGIVQESPLHNYADAAEVAFSHVTNAIVLDVVPRSITATTIAGNQVNTRINAAATATVNPSAGVDATGRRTIQVAAGDFIRSPTTGRVGFRATDLIEVTEVATGLVTGTFKLDAILTDTTFTVLTVTGALPLLAPSGSSASVRLRWLQVSASFGGQNRAGSGVTHGMPSLYVAQAGALTNAPASESIPIAALLMSAHTHRGYSAPEEQYSALTWGGFTLGGVPRLTGILQGDGGIQTIGGRQTLNQLSRGYTSLLYVSGGSTFVPDPNLTGTHFLLAASGTISATTVVSFSFSTATGWAAVNGDEVVVHVIVPPLVTGPLSITWPGNFIFSGSDGVIPATNSSGSEYLSVMYVLRYSSGFWYATRTDH